MAEQRANERKQSWKLPWNLKDEEAKEEKGTDGKVSLVNLHTLNYVQKNSTWKDMTP